MLEMTKDMLSFASTPALLINLNVAYTIPVGTDIISVVDAKGLLIHCCSCKHAIDCRF